MASFKLYDVEQYRNTAMLVLLTSFHNKFGTPYDGPARELGDAEAAFRLECHREEAGEYVKAIEEDKSLHDAIDALADELYFLTGTAHRQGFGLDVTEVSVDLGYRDVAPRFLCPETHKMRVARHAAVLHQYEERVRRGDLIGQALALREAIRAFRATAQMHGFDIDEALLRVHAANMTKDVDPSKQRRTQELKAQGIECGHLLEITKPDGWLAPYLGDLVGEGPYVEQEQFANTDSSLPAKKFEGLRGLITIDGPDASGKSTLAARIAELTDGQVIHLTWSPALEANMNEYRCCAIRYAAVLAKHCVVVLERPWLSHPIYAEVYRDGKCDMSDVVYWKKLVEVESLLNLYALPGNADRWLEGYQFMCSQRWELHGPEADKAMAVLRGFCDYFAGGQQALIPGGVVEAYDMFQYPTAEDRDQFIETYVIPKLEKQA